MSRVYSVEFENIAVTTANGDQDFFYIAPADDKPVAIHGLFLAVISELGDAQEEWLRFRVIRGHTTVGSGGAAATARPLYPNDGAAGFTARTNDTIIASVGSPVNLHSGALNVRAGYDLILTPEMRWKCSQLETSILVRLMAGPVDDVTMTGTLYLEEII